MFILNERNVKVNESSAVAIGKFDGIHLGHQLILSKLLEQKKKGLKTVIFTFAPSPDSFFGKTDEKGILSIEEKRKYFEDAGIDYYIEYPFDEKTASMEAEEFVENVLIHKLHTNVVIAGEDLSFGKNGKGDCNLMFTLQAKFHFILFVCEKIQRNRKVISSTLVKENIQNGNMEECRTLLGRPYCIEGKVIDGAHLGRTLKVPTCNLLPSVDKILPPNGVYFTITEYDGKKFQSVTDIGRKPTVQNSNSILVETHLLDFDENIYEKNICVSFFHYERPEKKFENLDELKIQLSFDIENARKYFQTEG